MPVRNSSLSFSALLFRPSLSLGFHSRILLPSFSPLQEPTMSLRHGTKVWVHDRDSAWIPAEVLESSGKKVTVATASGKKVSVLFLPNSRRLRF